MKKTISRRSAIRTLVGSAALIGAGSAPLARAADEAPVKLKGNVHHSVCKWCYEKIPLDDFCQSVKKIGLESVELLGPAEWPVLKKHGLVCAMCNGPDSIGYGFNRLEHHDKLVEGFQTLIPQAAEYGFPNMICFSGNRAGLPDEQGLENCVIGLKRVAPIAEKYKINVAMELLNSKVNHKDYMNDHTLWGVEVIKRVSSERCKLLYDIYHMQIMEGDVIHTIADYHQYICHYHTGGVPGRNEIDETQELYYPAVMKAIVATGYKGFVSQEFIPKNDPLTSLRKAVEICDV